MQRNRSYAFPWQAVRTSCPVKGEPGVDIWDEAASKYPECPWFDIENPTRRVGDTKGSQNNAPVSISSPTRPLVLYGRVWGTLHDKPFKTVKKATQKRAERVTNVCFSYLLEYTTDEISGLNLPPKNNVEQYHQFIIFKRRLFHCTLNGVVREQKTILKWICRGCVRTGDMFVSLEPGPKNVVLRKDSEDGDLFTVVAWGSSVFRAHDNEHLLWDGNDTVYHLVGENGDDWETCTLEQLRYPLGCRKKFEIR